jgi:isoleucyl-tRNA synthetase
MYRDGLPWDAHEHQIVKQLNAKGKKVEKVVLRQICREYADKYQKLQSTQFQRLGISGEWDHPYLTCRLIEAKILEVFGI